MKAKKQKKYYYIIEHGFDGEEIDVDYGIESVGGIFNTLDTAKEFIAEEYAEDDTSGYVSILECAGPTLKVVATVHIKVPTSTAELIWQ